MAKNMLVKAKILKVNTRFHAGIDVQPFIPCSFSPKIIILLRIQKVRVGVSLCVQLTSLNYFLWCYVINGETKFAYAIKALVILWVPYGQAKVK